MDDYSEKCYDLFKYTPMNKNSFFKVIIMLFFRSKFSHVLRWGNLGTNTIIDSIKCNFIFLDLRAVRILNDYQNWIVVYVPAYVNILVKYIYLLFWINMPNFGLRNSTSANIQRVDILLNRTNLIKLYVCLVMMGPDRHAQLSIIY